MHASGPGQPTTSPGALRACGRVGVWVRADVRVCADVAVRVSVCVTEVVVMCGCGWCHACVEVGLRRAEAHPSGKSTIPVSVLAATAAAIMKKKSRAIADPRGVRGVSLLGPGRGHVGRATSYTPRAGPGRRVGRVLAGCTHARATTNPSMGGPNAVRRTYQQFQPHFSSSAHAGAGQSRAAAPAAGPHWQS